MYLAVAATDFEMEPFQAACRTGRLDSLVAGVGPVETTVRLMSFLQGSGTRYKGVIHFGVGGAYIDSAGTPAAGLLDICLAETEVLGDLGISLEDGIEKITGPGLSVQDSFIMDAELLQMAGQALDAAGLPFRAGNFVTVSCASGTAARGTMLAERYNGLCENMEGAAVARVCREFSLPCLEVRCISNMVEDRDTSRWKLKQACRGAGEAAAAIVDYLAE